MELQTLLIRHSSGDAAYAKRLYKTLEKNGISSIDVLLEMSPYDISNIKGVGKRAEVIISRALTEERCERENKKETYKKQTKFNCQCLRDWFVRAGCRYTEACIIEKILKKEFNVKSIQDFLDIPFKDLFSVKGIGPVRSMKIQTVKMMIITSRVTS